MNIPATITRREALYGLGAGLGSVALTSLLGAAEAAGGTHHMARAKRCIFLMMEGGPSHIDTFDPKPALTKNHLKAFTRSGEMESAMSSGKRYFVKSPFEFVKAGACGADISTEWVHLKEMVDDMCFYRGAQVDSVNHPTACYQVNTGNQFGGDPGVGAWVNYGLGTLNENLPGFVVLPRTSYPQGGGRELDERVSAGGVSGDAVAGAGESDSEFASAGRGDAGTAAEEPGSDRGTQSRASRVAAGAE